MLNYFGRKQDLTCIQVRILYEYLVSFYIKLFIDKMYNLTRIDIKKLSDNDDYICLLAQCTNIIRSGIRKYARLRTSITQLSCTKVELNNRNRKEYECQLPIGPYEQCPTFSYLHNVKHKTCKQILKSSSKTNPLYSIGARFLMRNSIQPKKYS